MAEKSYRAAYEVLDDGVIRLEIPKEWAACLVESLEAANQYGESWTDWRDGAMHDLIKTALGDEAGSNHG